MDDSWSTMGAGALPLAGRVEPKHGPAVRACTSPLLASACPVAAGRHGGNAAAPSWLGSEAAGREQAGSRTGARTNLLCRVARGARRLLHPTQRALAQVFLHHDYRGTVGLLGLPAGFKSGALAAGGQREQRCSTAAAAPAPSVTPAPRQTLRARRLASDFLAAKERERAGRRRPAAAGAALPPTRAVCQTLVGMLSSQAAC